MEKGWPSYVHGTLKAPKDTEMTCTQGKGSIIDYAVVHHTMAHLVAVTTDNTAPWGPHYGLEITLDIASIEDSHVTWIEPKKLPHLSKEGQSTAWDDALMETQAPKALTHKPTNP